MKIILIMFLNLALYSFSTTRVWSADYQKGLDGWNKKDYATALQEWAPLAKKGDALAQFNLGMMYAFGKGVPKNYVYAYMWANLGASNGNEQGKMLRDYLKKKMAPADISTAQNRGQECARNNFKGC